MNDSYSAQAKNALAIAGKMARQYQHMYIGTEHLLMGLLKEVQGTAGMVLAEYGVEEEELTKLIDRLISPTSTVETDRQPVYTPRAKKLLEEAIREARHFGSDDIGTEHILIAMLKEADCVGTRLLYTMGVNIQKLYMSILAAMGGTHKLFKEELPEQRAKGAEGYSTPTLDQYSHDLTAMAKQGRLDPVLGREQEIERIIQILSRRIKNNPCLIGEAGVGKTAIAEGLT